MDRKHSNNLATSEETSPSHGRETERGKSIPAGGGWSFQRSASFLSDHDGTSEIIDINKNTTRR